MHFKGTKPWKIRTRSRDFSKESATRQVLESHTRSKHQLSQIIRTCKESSRAKDWWEIADLLKTMNDTLLSFISYCVVRCPWVQKNMWKLSQDNVYPLSQAGYYSPKSKQKGKRRRCVRGGRRWPEGGRWYLDNIYSLPISITAG